MKHAFQKIGFILLALMVAASTATAASKKLSYHYYDKKTKDVEEIHSVEYIELRSGGRQYTRTIEGEDFIQQEDLTLDEDFQSIEWHTVIDKDQTDYTGEFKDSAIIIKGIYKGEPVDKTIAIDDGHLFFYTPKLSLSKFALSNEEKTQFWTLRKDKLTKYLMQAEKRGVVTIEVDGEEIPAIEVAYSATGPGAKFYRRNYYFRKSDGVFLKKTDPKGVAASAELVTQ